MSWRQALANIDLMDGDIYQFGVLRGDSLIEIDSLIKGRMKKPKMFGFDSFQGMPKNNEGIPGWEEGEMDSRKHLGCNTVVQCMDIIRDRFNNRDKFADLYLIPGYYDKLISLDYLSTEFEMEPAAYIDIDCDLYQSTAEAFSFMLTHGLIDIGTVIGYDDWGGTHGYETMSDGESLAHKEFILANFEVECIFSIGDYFPHIQKLFRVTGVK